MFDNVWYLWLYDVVYNIYNQPPQPSGRMFLQVVEGMNYAMCIIASIMGQAVETGSTPVLQAWRAELSHEHQSIGIYNDVYITLW